MLPPLATVMWRTWTEVLTRELRRRGLYVRRHAYEILVGDGEEFLCILLLEPVRRSLTLIVLRDLHRVGPILQTVREVLRDFSIYLRPSPLLLEEEMRRSTR